MASSPFARRDLGNRCFFLFLQVLRCFSSLGFLRLSYFIQTGMTVHYYSRVAPFGNLRIIGYLLLPAAYRSLSRPSSAPSAKASALCPFSLDLRLVNLFVCFVAVRRSLSYVLRYTPSLTPRIPCIPADLLRRHTFSTINHLPSL